MLKGRGIHLGAEKRLFLIIFVRETISDRAFFYLTRGRPGTVFLFSLKLREIKVHYLSTILPVFEKLALYIFKTPSSSRYGENAAIISQR